jgi:hypothetical protein
VTGAPVTGFLLGRKDGATVEQLTKGLAEYGVKTDRQVRMVIDRMRYGYEAKIKNVGAGRSRVTLDDATLY